MSDAVEIYLKYAGPIEVLTRRVAETLELSGYFRSHPGFTAGLDAEPWIGTPTLAVLDLDPNEWRLERDLSPEDWEEEDAPAAYLPYEYELILEMRGSTDDLVRLGRMVLERLTGLGLPLAYQGIGTEVLADFLPGRGVREFPPRVFPEPADRVRWYEPTLHDDPDAPWRPEPVQPVAPAGRVVVFESGGLLQLVPLAQTGGGWRWVAPVASIRVDHGARDVGLLLGSVLATIARPERDDREAIARSLMRLPRGSIVDSNDIENFGRRSVSVEVRSDGAAVAAIPHGPHRGTPDEPPSGPVIEELVRQESTSKLDAAALGALVLEQVAAVRERVPA